VVLCLVTMKKVVINIRDETSVGLPCTSFATMGKGPLSVCLQFNFYIKRGTMVTPLRFNDSKGDIPSSDSIEL
jgi:hypothetical protein